MVIFCIIFNDNFWFAIKLSYIFIFIISLYFFVKRTKTSLLSFHFKTYILLLFFLSITFPRFNLIIIISFKFYLRSIRNISIKYIFFFISLFAKFTLLYMYSFYETHFYINPLQYLIVLHILFPEFFLCRYENYIENRIHNL